MARTKRQYGSGCLLRRKGGWVIRWRETEIRLDSTKRRILRYETLGAISRKQAGDILTQRIVAASTKKIVTRVTLTFRELVSQWQATVLPMYKHSTQKHRRFFAVKHLLPRFGEVFVTAMTRQEIQVYVTHLTQVGYAPKSVDNIHDTLSAILRTAVEWGHLPDNPAKGVRLPKLRTVRPRWVLTTAQATTLLQSLAVLPRTMVGLAIATGLRRGELFALRWKDVDQPARVLTVRQAVYDGTFGTPKTEAGCRQVPLSAAAVHLLAAWKAQALVSDLGGIGVCHAARDPAVAQQHATEHFSGVRRLRTSPCHVAHLPTHLLVVVARQGRARQSGREADGARERRHDAQRLHAGFG
jgi:integrase